MATVTYGIYYSFTEAELDDEKAKYKKAVQQRGNMQQAAGGGVILSGSVNGQSVSFDYPQGVNSLKQWEEELQDAYAQLDADVKSPYSTRSVVKFQ